MVTCTSLLVIAAQMGQTYAKFFSPMFQSIQVQLACAACIGACEGLSEPCWRLSAWQRVPMAWEGGGGGAAWFSPSCQIRDGSCVVPASDVCLSDSSSGVLIPGRRGSNSAAPRPPHSGKRHAGGDGATTLTPERSRTAA